MHSKTGLLDCGAAGTERHQRLQKSCQEWSSLRRERLSFYITTLMDRAQHCQPLNLQCRWWQESSITVPSATFLALTNYKWYNLYTFGCCFLNKPIGLPDCRWRPLVQGSQLYPAGCLGRGPRLSSGRAAHLRRSKQTHAHSHVTEAHAKQMKTILCMFFTSCFFVLQTLIIWIWCLHKCAVD